MIDSYSLDEFRQSYDECRSHCMFSSCDLAHTFITANFMTKLNPKFCCSLAETPHENYLLLFDIKNQNKTPCI